MCVKKWFSTRRLTSSHNLLLSKPWWTTKPPLTGKLMLVNPHACLTPLFTLQTRKPTRANGLNYVYTTRWLLLHNSYMLCSFFWAHCFSLWPDQWAPKEKKKDWNAGQCYQGRPEILLTSWGYGEEICSCTQKNTILGLHKHESMILNKMQLKYWKR